MHHVTGVCCIVFDIDGMLFEFFMNFLNIEKNKIIYLKKYFMFSSRFMLFPTLQKINKNGVDNFFLSKPILFHFVLCYFFNIKNKY